MHTETGSLKDGLKSFWTSLLAGGWEVTLPSYLGNNNKNI